MDEHLRKCNLGINRAREENNGEKISLWYLFNTLNLTYSKRRMNSEAACSVNVWRDISKRSRRRCSCQGNLCLPSDLLKRRYRVCFSSFMWQLTKEFSFTEPPLSLIHAWIFKAAEEDLKEDQGEQVKANNSTVRGSNRGNKSLRRETR